MHRCFQTPDIVRLIVNSLWGANERRIDNPADPVSLRVTYRSLACLARTCKTLQPHALDALWSLQWGIENLLRCMHPRLLVTKKVSLGPAKGKIFMLCLTKTKLDPTDWGNFDSYAHRIKRLKISWPGHLTLTPAEPCVYRALAICDHHRRPYLPNLTHLTYDMSELSPDILSFCVTLLGPSTRSLHVHGGQGDLITMPFLLSSSLRLSPSIRELALTLGSSPDGFSSFTNALKLLDRVHTLSLTLHAPPPVELWNALAAAPPLIRLTLGLPRGSLWNSAITSNLDSGTVLNLSRITHLTLRDVNAADCVRIFGSCSFASLVGVYITFPFRGPANGLELAEALAASCPPTLRELSLHSSVKPFLGIPADRLLLFCGCREVERVDLSVVSDLDDATLEGIARMWPNLRKLDLMSHRGQQPREQPEGNGTTPEGLANLVSACPHLRELSLQTDFRCVDISKDRPWSGSTSEHIRAVDVGSSLIADAALTAAFLSDLFPNLVAISQHGGTPDPAGRWAEVVRLLSIFTTVRAQERRRHTQSAQRTAEFEGRRPQGSTVMTTAPTTRITVLEPVAGID
ncbi:uncharacterized protein B0H18DRAFT_132004 [Fomitopsis serialis]|uniref:uncharacterized protein n=1 Tax=Fomitopsis serialis TaxID=139415 RepID=UPI002008B16D|nr:uncharacterized protein B0H18DRAFT_132004 [Neoantrodia serialis]KAH9930677.1 hypothetical protein B0H18DRAFT_132004 [Neoantrodia serialis]